MPVMSRASAFRSLCLAVTVATPAPAIEKAERMVGATMPASSSIITSSPVSTSRK